MTAVKAVESQRQNKTRPGDWRSRSRKGLNMSSLVDRGHSRKLPVDLAHFPPRLTAKLGNVDSRNLTCAVVLATLERWNIPHADGVTYVQRAEARNLRRECSGQGGCGHAPRARAR